eukprot:m51a1_g4183 hypothetical protein (196) ;mRNA; f:367574-372924
MLGVPVTAEVKYGDSVATGTLGLGPAWTAAKAPAGSAPADALGSAAAAVANEDTSLRTTTQTFTQPVFEKSYRRYHDNELSTAYAVSFYSVRISASTHQELIGGYFVTEPATPVTYGIEIIETYALKTALDEHNLEATVSIRTLVPKNPQVQDLWNAGCYVDYGAYSGNVSDLQNGSPATSWAYEMISRVKSKAA